MEGRDKTGERFTGRTRGNRVCVFDADPRLVGLRVPLKIERASVSTLYGQLVLKEVDNPAPRTESRKPAPLSSGL